MKKKNSKKNIRRINKKENKLKEKILEINLSKATIVTSIIVILSIALITAGIIKTISESSKEKVEVEQEEEYSPVNWIESTEIGEDGNYKKVPVPKGYVASQIEGETTVNGGFVIYEDNYNGKSINWDEIIIKDDGSSAESSSASGASVVNADDGEKEEGTNLEMPKTSSEVTPSEEEPLGETATFPENMSSEGEQPEQEESIGNNESPVVDEEGISPEERATSEKNTQNENEGTAQEEGVAPVAEGEGKETTDPTEPETPATPTAEQQTKKNIFNLQKNVNQYVWVPVPDINRICGVDKNGKLWGKLYSFNNSGGNNACTDYSGYSWTEVDGKIVTPPSGKNKSGNWFREPDVEHYNGYDVDRYMKNYMYGETQYEMLAKEMEQNFYETMKSIEKYGGYYIGRYETGGLNSKAVVQKMQNGDYVTNRQSWYTMYKKCNELAGSNENVKTSMIWGSLWDETLKWLVESGAKTTGTDTQSSQTITYSLINNSTTWGNHANSNKFKYILSRAEEPEATTEKESGNIRIPTGSAEYTKANNIYDLAGNMWEWTLEAYFNYRRVYRGGGCDSNGSSSPVLSRIGNYGPTYDYFDLGSRAALIIR